jgi:predicted nucleic acid-binding protein
MSFLLDTCVVSEATKERRDLGVQKWLDATASELLFFSAITFGELKFCVERLPKGAKRERLEVWLAEFVMDTPPSRIIPIDRDIALLWADLRVRDPNCRLVDSQIAATALAHSLTSSPATCAISRSPGFPSSIRGRSEAQWAK